MGKCLGQGGKSDLAQNGTYKPIDTTTGRVPLKIDRYTIIYVSPDKASEEYAEAYRRRVEKNWLKVQWVD